MGIDINDYFTIKFLKNGKCKIFQSDDNKFNIYVLLHESGFRKTTLNNKRIYYRILDKKITPVNFVNMRIFLKNILLNREFANVLENIVCNSIIDFYIQNQIKQSIQLDRYLLDYLNEEEAHSLRMHNDVNYKHSFEIQSMLEHFEEYGYKKIIDSGSSFCSNSPLYYKNIEKNEFLIFCHYNSNSKINNDGFDCYTATYQHAKHIGNMKPVSYKQIKLSFVLERDFNLIHSSALNKN